MASTTVTAPAITVEMRRVKETKNTFRYESDDETAPIGNVYLDKTAAAELGNPATITVTVTTAA